MNQQADPRNSLSSYKSNIDGKFSSAEYECFYKIQPQIKNEYANIWYSRGQNFIVANAEVLPDAIINRENQIDEYVMLIPDSEMNVEVVWDGKSHNIQGHTITFIPSGFSSIKSNTKGRIILFYTTENKDLTELCNNNRSYENRHDFLPNFKKWPEPVGGFKVRSYSLDVADEPNRFGRIWRCTTFMINVIPGFDGPRDVQHLSPHSHDDFEQGSYVLEGEFTHHIRWPWTSNMNDWKEDEHVVCKSQSLTVIPPRAIHTSCAIGASINQLIDIFSPPREDFSLKAGWVLNADEYPMPE
jgi:mannose-6-phosphate isomerase-like protein (cupin superfamily)